MSRRAYSGVWAGTLQPMSTVVERLTADEYLSRDDRRRTELIDGLVVVHQPTQRHQDALLRIVVAIELWIRAGGRGKVSLPLDVPLDERNVLAPDILWFAEPLPADAPNAIRPPDLVVEVRSPSTWGYDIGRKRELYEKHGVREIWLVDTASRTVITRVPGGHMEELAPGRQLTSKLLPGFRLAVADIFGS